MIFELFRAQASRLAAAISCVSGRSPDRERERLEAVAATVSASVADLFVAAGLPADVAEIASQAYAAGWLDASHRETGSTLAYAVIERRSPHFDQDRAAPVPRRLN